MLLLARLIRGREQDVPLSARPLSAVRRPRRSKPRRNARPGAPGRAFVTESRDRLLTVALRPLAIDQATGLVKESSLAAGRLPASSGWPCAFIA